MKKIIIIFTLFFLILVNVSIFYESNLYIKKEIQLKNFIFSINFINKINSNYEDLKKQSVPIHKLLLGKDGQPCYGKKPDELLKNCFFFHESNSKNFYLIGGSQISTLSYNLKLRLKDFNYVQFTMGNLVYLPDFYQIDRIENKKIDNFTEYNDLIKSTISSVSKKSIVVIGARYPLYLNKSFFDNKEGGIEGGVWKGKFEHVEKLNIKWENSFKNSVEELLLNKNTRIILIYPIPEVGFKPVDRLNNYMFMQKELQLKDTSFEVFKERTKTSFELLDSIKGENIYRVYPHTLFCDTIIKNRCVNHDDNYIFYTDANHPSLKGAEIINDLIMKEIEKIELVSN